MEYVKHAGLPLRKPLLAMVRICLLAILIPSQSVLAQENTLGETPAPKAGGYAGQKSLQHNIDLNWALQQTLEKNAALRTYPYHLRVSDAAILQAEQRPLPTLGISIENVLGNGDFKKSEQAEYTLTLGQTIELGGKRNSRVAVATAAMEKTQSEYQLTRLDVLAETSRRYYQLLRIQLLQSWIDRRKKSEQQALDIIQQRANAGVAKQADVSKIRLRLARSEAKSAQLTGQFALAKGQLAAMWMEAANFTVASGDLLSLPTVPRTTDINQSVVDWVNKSPTFIRQQALQRLADAEVQLARANAKVNMDIGIGLRHLEESGDQALVFDVSMPLAIRNPNRGQIAAAEANKALSSEQMDITRQQLQLSLLAIQQTLASQHQYATLITRELLPQARELLADVKKGYRLGRHTVLEWLDAQAERFNLERELIETHTLMYQQLLELERITGRSFSNLELSNPKQGEIQ